MITPNLQLPKWLTLTIIFPFIFLDGWLLILLLRYLQPITSIVISASLIAFLLQFPIVFLEQRGLAKGWAIAFVFLIALLSISTVSLVLGPVIFEQTIDFANRLPMLLEKAELQLQAFYGQSILPNLPFDLDNLSDQTIQQLTNAVQEFTSQILNFALETISSTVNLLLTVVLSILLVISGPGLWQGTVSWLPTVWQDRVQTSLQPSLQGYFLGQATIALILGTALSITFTVLGIPFGLLFGVVIGLANIIPFGGTVSIILLSGLLAFQSPLLGLKVLIPSFILGQINDNVIAPRIIGSMIGLNSAVVLISLLIGAKAAGFLGLILAVPTASFLKRLGDMARAT